MASARSFSVEDARKSILENGIFYMDDGAVGDWVAEFEEKGLPTKTEYGLDFCASNTLDRQEIRDIVESILDKPRFGLLKIYGELPKDLTFFIHNRLDSDEPTHTLLIQLWSRKTSVDFLHYSHLRTLNAQESEYDLLARPRKELADRDDIQFKNARMSEGGLAIIDSRLGFTRLEGFVIILGFATEAEVQEWGKMELPDNENLRKKVDELESKRNIRTNFKYVKRSGS